MTERLTDEQIHHAANEALLGEATQIKQERAVVKERLEKLDSSRDGISATVYQRVRADYVDRLNKTMERLLALKNNLEEEQKALVQKKLAVEQALDKGKETVEESALRHALGEFSAQEHESTVRGAGQETKRLQGALEEIKKSLDRYLKIFEGEEMLRPAAPHRPAPAPAAPAPPPAHQKFQAPIPQQPLRPAPAESPEPGTMKFHEAEIVTDQAERSGEPRAVKVPQLQVMENGRVAQSVPIDRTIQIGRSPANDIVLKEPKVSRKHAEIHSAAGKHILLDLESSNGTFVRGKKVTEYVLEPDDEIRIGNTTIVFKN